MFDNPTAAELASYPAPSEHPVTRVKTMLAAEIALSVILTIILALRYASRIFVTKAFTADDWILIPAYVFTLAFNIDSMVAGHYGWGWHLWDIPQTRIETLLKLIYVQIPLFVTANMLIKISIILFYTRIFCTGKTSPWFCRSLRALTVFIILWWLAYIILGIFVCQPIRAYWNLMPIKGQTCYDVEGYISYGGIDIMIDLILLLLPQWKIWHLHMPWPRKIAVGIVMSFAALAVVAGTMRLPFILRTTLSGSDKTWEGMELTIWSTTELTLGIGCASAPALRAFFTRKNAPVLAGGGRSLQEWAQRSIQTATGNGGGRFPVADIEAGSIVALRDDDDSFVRNEKQPAGRYGEKTHHVSLHHPI